MAIPTKKKLEKSGTISLNHETGKHETREETDEQLSERQKKYDDLQETAMSLGSAFQKVNFLRDLKADFEGLNRTYFPNTDLANLDELAKQNIINDIESDFGKGLEGIRKLPMEAKFGVFMAYRYYSQLLKKLKRTPALEIKSARIRVPNYKKIELLTRSYVKFQLNLL